MNIFLSCVKAKQNTKCAAEEMYISPLFKKSLQYAKTYQHANIYILSAKYGLLKLSDMIEPYDKTLNDMNKQERERWGIMVLEQCKDNNVDFNDETIFLCGKNYRKYISRYFPQSTNPLEHLGIGKQLQFYTRQLKEIE
jgi:cytoplasmic iron level regulating protein YaaA (DUF328/UPF0246 family)